MKHGIHFRTATKVFLDPNKMIREDEEHPEELRYDILGRVGKILFVVCAFRDRNVIRMISARDILGRVGKILFVVCAFRDRNVIRMISARLATTSEKERYEHGEDDYE